MSNMLHENVLSFIVVETQTTFNDRFGYEFLDDNFECYL